MTYFGPLTDTLIVDGVDLQNIAGITVTNLDGLLAPGTRRGENVVVPGRRGAIGVPKVYDAYEFAVGITVDGGDGTAQARRVTMLARLATLSAALDGDGGLVTLTRRIANSTTYVEHTASGEFVDGLQVTLLNADTGETELQFVNLDGAWFASGAPTVPIVP